MSDPLIENRALRYAASFAVVLAIVMAGIAVLHVLPSSIDADGPGGWAVYLIVAVLSVEAMGRIERGVSPIRTLLG